MERYLVTVKYIYEGKQFDHENEPGVLLPNSRVFVTGESLSIFDYTPTNDPNVVVVNLDEGYNDYYREGDEDFLINLIVS
ncbi:hypothetical protein [Bacillus sp. AFS041924]|uniref:hypothetical protein n=1 Tax=Bacillus sp. AFS041924 TaxID=2033503 RepID=UPI000BFB5594|nr:hypothetical protein [Bacillus sp. AFS041924]PGS55105.1 hypothetical protein COC46_04055 [Bacillus sp. AFS041924]